ncbi:MAG: mechanosensitive ion channel family protein [Gammaproteobacteria bacterium]
MHDLKIGETDILAILRPDSFFGALIYLAFFVIVALLISRALRAAVHAAMTRKGHADLTTISFLQQLGSALTWVVVLILYAHLVPVLRSMGNALLAGASIASVVIGLAAQSTLGNLIAGIAITIYRPFRLGDRLQVATPTGTEIGTVQLISLGYTTLRTGDDRQVVLPNSLAASQVILNLTAMRTSPRLSINIRVSRTAPIEKVQEAALTAAKSVVDESAVRGCYLKTIEADAAVLVLTVELPAAESAEATRAKLLSALAQRTSAAGLDEGNRATFS